MWEERCHRATDCVCVNSCGLCAGKHCCLAGSNGSKRGYGQGPRLLCPHHPQVPTSSQGSPGTTAAPSTLFLPSNPEPLSMLYSQSLWQDFAPDNLSCHHPTRGPVRGAACGAGSSKQGSGICLGGCGEHMHVCIRPICAHKHLIL